ncbi:GyrI-like domain-containing protein [Rufibacter psychrotolerans]|uniref:GyrI-like domain-containing protein n=1 Tax=Rufibacter psychrotolerans TaxID=2812556 RepID=UPI00196727C2|nr:GyrI-like domain-containing protein [Rufibacter sp. SYSU D00308]
MEVPPRIEVLPPTTLVGLRVTMAMAADQTQALWRRFGPRRKEIRNVAGPERYSVEVYPDPAFFTRYNPTLEFEKWAAVQVSDPAPVPAGLEVLQVPGGAYAVFGYKGRSSEAQRAYQFIFGTWLPGSAYELDHRPHFAKMGEKYRNDDPASEEEIWIPVRTRTL